MENILKHLSKKTGLGTLYIKGYIEKTNFELYKELYCRSQYIMGGIEYHKKNINDFTKEFDNLIESFKKKGFDHNNPITVSNELLPIDGHHRASCCVYFNIKPKYIIDNNISFGSYNGLEWLIGKNIQSKCFSLNDKIHILKDYNKFNNINLLISNNKDTKSTICKLNKENIKILGIIRFDLKNKIINIHNYKIKKKNTLIITANNYNFFKLKFNYLNNNKTQEEIKNIFLSPKNVKKYILKDTTKYNKIIILFLHYKNKIIKIIFELIIKYIKKGNNMTT